MHHLCGEVLAGVGARRLDVFGVAAVQRRIDFGALLLVPAKELVQIADDLGELRCRQRGQVGDAECGEAVGENGCTTQIDESSDDWKNYRQRSALKKEIRTKKEAFKKEVGKKLETEDPTFKALIEKEKQLEEQFKYLGSRMKKIK